MMPGMPEKHPQDYARRGTTSLFAGFNTADGTVIYCLQRRHRATEFSTFLAKIDTHVPDDLGGAPSSATTTPPPDGDRAARRVPPLPQRFASTYSYRINQVERFSPAKCAYPQQVNVRPTDAAVVG